MLESQCCIVGAGPAGVMAAYLLAQRGVEVLLLESHHDFDRDFRGDTLHSGIMELLDDLGLAEELLRLPHAKMGAMQFQQDGITAAMVDFSQLRSPYPFVTMMPQSQFLEFMVERTRRFRNFTIRMGATARGLSLVGNAYVVDVRDDEGEYRVRADLILGCDGRHSRLRRSLGLTPIKAAVPMDVIWFRVPRRDGDGVRPGGYVGQGHLLIVLQREHEWQIGYVFTHGGFTEVKSKGIDWWKREVASTLPAVGLGMSRITKWQDVAVLNVESSRLRRWYDRNVLLIGDASHVMSPVGGVGINYAIQDAVVTAGVVTEALLTGRLTTRQLAQVQRKRALPTRLVQAFQAVVQRRVVRAALAGGRLRLPSVMRWRCFRNWVARFLSHGVFPVQVPAANRRDTQSG